MVKAKTKLRIRTDKQTYDPLLEHKLIDQLIGGPIVKGDSVVGVINEAAIQYGDKSDYVDVTMTLFDDFILCENNGGYNKIKIMSNA